MTDRRRPEDSTLLDILIDGFEKNEVLGGMHLRRLPLPSAEAGRAVFDRFVAEASTWQGAPTDVRDEGHRAVVRWPDLEIWWAGRGIHIRARSSVRHWWHALSTWADDPTEAVWAFRDELKNG